MWKHLQHTAHRTVLEGHGRMTREAERENTGGGNVLVEGRVQTPQESYRPFTKQQAAGLDGTTLTTSTTHRPLFPPLELKPAVELCIIVRSSGLLHIYILFVAR